MISLQHALRSPGFHLPRLTLCAVLVVLVAAGSLQAEGVLRKSDVVFMYQADRATYAAYGATVLAWGGTPTHKSRAEAEGIRYFGSVGMVTEFSAYHRRYPDRYEEGLCRDLDGKPVKVPWLTDHSSQGVPYWWCCTQQPNFRDFIRDRVTETVMAGADGVHIDDHLGTAGGLWLGLCFCDRCVAGFREYLAALPSAERDRLGLAAAQDFDFRAEVRRWRAAEGAGRQPPAHPLWPRWTAYQCRAAANFMRELRELAASKAKRPIPIGANAGLLWPRHLSDYEAVDLFSAETDHHAEQRRFSNLPLLAYRMAEAMGRPYAATASGRDWAFIKEHDRPGLVQGWIALAYASGQCLMAPHRQWCYTPEKGTHWYAGPSAKFVPLYQFVRQQAEWFDGFKTYADVTVVMPHRSFVKDTQRWLHIADQLASANLSFRVLIAGDEIIDHPLEQVDLDTAGLLLVPEQDELLPADAQRIRTQSGKQKLVTTVDDVENRCTPAVSVKAGAKVRVLPRVKPGLAVVHLVNYDYDFAADQVRPMEQVRVRLDARALGLSAEPTCSWITPEAEPVKVVWRDGEILVPRLNLWGFLAIE